MENEKQIIEINGIKMEVDLRHAKRIDTFCVGDCVKVLVKEYDAYKTYAGTIVGFDAFEKLPTIIVAYVKYSGLEFVYINANSKAENQAEICMAHEDDIPLHKEDILNRMGNEIETSERKTLELKDKKARFLKLFGKYFSQDDDANMSVQ
ncbi:hypothetical protein [Caudoviricetes sp.]|nr:hypothetical protein [Caudoviricetes sp.]